MFGGEPTLRKDFIKELVAWIYKQDFQKPYVVFIETNGTLVHGEFQDWLITNKTHVWAGLSLDGSPETHNANRSKSYNKIDIDFFTKNYPTQSVRMTIHPNTVKNLCEDIVHLHKLKFQDVVATFAHGVVWDVPGIKEQLGLSLERLCSFYLAHPEIKECSILDMHLPNILGEDKGVKKWCGTGTHIVSYDVGGKRYPCHTFQRITVGDVASEWEEMNGPTDFNKITDFRDSDCSSCVIEGICPNCYGMNYVVNGNVLRRDKQLCPIVKLQALANSYLMGESIRRGLKKMDPPKTFQMITAIQLIQDRLLGLN